MPRTPEQVYTELLVLRCQAGDRASLGELYALWAPRFRRHATSLLGRSDQGADAAQDAWVSIAGSISSLSDPGRFAPWAYRVVTNRCADSVRRAQRDRRAARGAGEAGRVNQVEISDDSGGEDLDALRGAIRALDTDHRVVVELFYLDGLGVREIGGALGIAPGTVKSRLFNARAKLRRAMEGGES